MGVRLAERVVGAVTLSAWLGSAPMAQWAPATVALRTNGSILRSGDCLRLELIAIDHAPGPFVAQVRYTVPRVVELADGPTLDAMLPRQAVVLDDTLCLGEGSAPGAYDIEVKLLAPGASSPFSVLHSCIVYDNGGSVGSKSCGLMLRGVKRVDADDTIVFDGDFPGHGPYRVAVFHDRTLEALIDAGVYQTGPHELVINAPGLSAWSSQPVDLVLLDETRGDSTTFSRLLVPRE